MNFRTLAKQLTLAEGLRESISIAQMCEILSILIAEMAEDEEIGLYLARAALKKHRKRRGKS